MNNSMLNQLSKLENLVFHNSRMIAFFCLLLSLSFIVIVPLFGDDLDLFAKETFSLEWLKSRYSSWSSRVVIESILPYLSRHEFLLKTINCILVLSAAIAIYILNQKNKLSSATCILIICIFPFYKVATAGYSATIINYLYPIIFSLWLLTYLFAIKASKFGYIPLIIMSIFVTNHEICAVMMLSISTAALFLKNSDKLLAVILIISAILGLIFIILCPGNSLRLADETMTWMPEFANYSLTNKIELGIKSALYFLNYKGPVPFVFCYTAIAFAFSKKLIPSLICAILITLIINFILKPYINPAVINHDSNWIHNFPLSSLLVLFLMPISMILLIFFSNISTSDKVLLILLISLAYALRSSMGFSPTVFASSERPSLFSHMLLILCGLFAMLKSHVDKRKMIVIISLFSLYSSTNSFIKAIRLFKAHVIN